MGFDLRYQVNGKSLTGDTLRLDILQLDSAASIVINNVNAIFATLQILTDVDLTALVGDTLNVSGSQNNDKSYTVTGVSASGVPLYPFLYDVSETVSTLEEDTSGFTITISNTKTVSTSPEVFTIKWGEENTPDGTDRHSKYQPIQRAYLTVKLKNNISREFEDLFLTDDWICEAYRNGDPFFYGVIRAQTYQAPMKRAPYFTEVIFSDGLDTLGEQVFFIPNPDTRQSIGAVLGHALQQTGFALPIYEVANLYAEGFTQTEDDSPLDQGEVMPEYWYQTGGTFLDFITDICIVFGARIFQYEGAWYFHRINEYAGEYLERQFDSSGVLVAASSVWYDTTLTITETNDPQEDELSVLRKADYIKVEVEPGEEKSYFNNSFLEEITADVPDGWTNSGLTLTELTDRVTGTKSLKVGSTASSNFMLHDDVLVMDNISNPTIKGFYKYNSLTGLALNSEGYMFRYSIKANAYWLTDSGGWDNGSGEQIIDHEDWIYPDVWTSFSISIPATSHPDGTAITIIFKIHGGRDVTFDSISITGKSLNNNTPSSPRPYVFDNGVVPGGDGAKSIPVNLSSGIFQGTGASNRTHSSVITEGVKWERRGVSESLELGGILLEAVKDENSVNQMVIIASIFSGYSMRFPLKISYLGADRRFIANGVVYDAGSNAWKGQFMEIVSVKKYSQLPPI